MTYIHLEAENIRLHMEVEECYVDSDGTLRIATYGFISIRAFINRISYFSAFEDNERTIFIKDGKLLFEKHMIL